jgi:general secretion pathway protein D
VLAVALLGSCAPGQRASDYFPKDDYADRYSEMHRKEIKENLLAKAEPKNAAPEPAPVPPVPEVSQLLVAPRPQEGQSDQLVSIAVTEDVPLRDVFIELARLANLSLQMDSSVSGGVVYRAKDRPLNEVVRQITDMAGLRYEIDGKRLKVERDMPVLRSYELDFLNVDRTSTGGVNINTNVLSSSVGGAGGGAGGGGGGGGGGAAGGGNAGLNSGSQATVKTENKSDLWSQFEAAIKAIVEGDDTKAGGGQAAAGADKSGSGNNQDTKPFYVMNKEAGLLTVFGGERQQTKVQGFIQELTRKAAAQVLIEAKIVEVGLSDKFRSGIDWGSLMLDRLKFDFDVVTTTATTFENSNVLALRARNKKNGTLEGAIQLVEQFGQTRTLSSPRLHAMNNQQAVMTFAENRVYFQLDIQRERDTSTGGVGNELLTVDSTPVTVPIGLILTLMPSINEKSQEITLNLRPTLSRVVDEVRDPAVGFLLNQSSGGSSTALENIIPVVEVREMDTVMKLSSGDIMVMGGLMQERHINDDTGVPFVSGVPWLGNLFKRTTKDTEVVEMVIFIKATIVPTSGTIDAQDINVYKKFTNDPRPLTF